MIRDCPASVHLRGLRHRLCTSIRRRRNWSFDRRAQCVKELPGKGRPGFGFVRDRRRRVRRHRWSEWMREEHAFANAYGPRATNNRNHRGERESGERRFNAPVSFRNRRYCRGGLSTRTSLCLSNCRRLLGPIGGSECSIVWLRSASRWPTQRKVRGNCREVCECEFRSLARW